MRDGCIALVVFAWVLEKPSTLAKLAAVLLVAAGLMKGLEQPTAMFWIGAAAVLLVGIGRWRRRENSRGLPLPARSSAR